MKFLCIVTGLVVFCVFMVPFVGYAEFYRWLDEQGEMHYSTVAPSDTIYTIEIKTKAGWQIYRAGNAEKAPIPIRQRTGSGVTKANVKYIKKGNMMLFDVRLNDKTDTRLMMDTGASYIVISTETAEKMGLPLDSKLPMIELVTANGTVNVPLVNLEVVKVGGIEAYNVTAAVHDSGDSEFMDGLLGMSFFKRFEINVDRKQNQITLEALYPPEKYAAMDCVQSMELFSQGNLAGKDLDKAAAYYEKAILLCDDIYGAYYALAELYYAQEKYATGVKTFLKAIRQYPDNAHAHFLLGVFYAYDDKFAQARRALKTTLQLDPDHEGAQAMLESMQGKAYQRRGN